MSKICIYKKNMWSAMLSLLVVLPGELSCLERSYQQLATELVSIPLSSPNVPSSQAPDPIQERKALHRDQLKQIKWDGYKEDLCRLALGTVSAILSSGFVVCLALVVPCKD